MNIKKLLKIVEKRVPQNISVKELMVKISIFSDCAGGDKTDLVRQPSVSLSVSPGINWLSVSWRSPDGLPSAIFTQQT